ncbi:hypothetical protein ACJJTC_003745, partial [Scirpophaga incertulas]
MALRHDAMDPTFLTADPPPITTVEYQPKSDLASEYFNTFSQICENYGRDTDLNLRQTSESLRLSSEILQGVRSEYTETQEYITTDFNEKVLLKDEHVFQFGQPDASALLRHRARRRYNEEHGLQPPPATSQESGYGSDEFGHDSPSRYASPKGAGGGGGQYPEPYYGGGDWPGAGGYYQPAPYDPYTSPGTIVHLKRQVGRPDGIAGSGGGGGGGGGGPEAAAGGVAAAGAGAGAGAGGAAELPLPPMSSFRAAAPHHSPDPMLLPKPAPQPMYAGAVVGGVVEGSLSSYGSSPSTPVHSPPPHRLYPRHPLHQQSNWVGSGVSSPPAAGPIPAPVLPNGHHAVFPPPVMGAPAEQRQLDEAMVFLREHSDVG